MNTKDLIHLKAWFADYVSGFYTDDPDDDRPITLKEKHTTRVCQDITMLGRELKLSAQDMLLAETMALFHDIGRFKQYAAYRTFNDRASENHAILGLQQLTSRSVLAALTREEKRLVIRAIEYHNAIALPENENGKTLFFMRLLRDADKLDIWRVFVDYYQERDKKLNATVELGLPDNPTYSQKIIEPFHKRQTARMEDLKTLNDFKLLQISWVFDLNLIPSFQAVQRRKYIARIAKTLPQTIEITEAVKQAYNYVEACAICSDSIKLPGKFSGCTIENFSP